MKWEIGICLALSVVLASSLGAAGPTPVVPSADEQYFHHGLQLQKEGRYTEAVEMYTAALDEVERRLGPESIASAQILINIGTVRALQHDDLRAKTAFEQALNITEKALGSEHVQVGLTLLTVAMLTHKEGHYAAAEQLYRRAFTILEKNLGSLHERTGFLEASMARLYLVQRRNSEAEALLEKAIPVLENAGEPDEATLVVALADLAEAYRQDGRYAKAGPLYAHILAMVQQKPQELNHDIRTSLRAYVHMLRKMKRKTEARELDQQLKTMRPR
jgi:tetratricopeptide (TPR) repeat protein